MKSLRSHEGYLLLDHSDSPGVSDEALSQHELPRGAGRTFFEAPTYTCSHCQRIVIVNPDRVRDRAYCRKCDHRICDECGGVAAATGECRTFRQVIDEVQEAVARGLPIPTFTPFGA